MPQKHSDFPPSSMERLILCSASWSRSKGIDRPESAVMREGTKAHSLLESRLRGEVLTLKEKSDLPEDMLPAVEICVDEVNRLREEWPGGEGIEMQVDLSWWGLPEVWGTVDYGRWNYFNNIKLLDYKHGQGVVVQPTTPQLLTYGAGLLSDLYGMGYEGQFGEIELIIVQPRGKDGRPIKNYTLSVDDLVVWITDTLQPSIAAAKKPDPVATPGDKQCMWCPAKTKCPEYQNAALAVADMELRDLAATVQPKMPMLPTDPHVLADVYSKLPLLKDWIKHIEGAVFGKLERKEVVPGYKMGTGRNSRKWADPKKAEQKLLQLGLTKDEIYPPSDLISPNKAEKLSGKKKKELVEYIKVMKGKPVIVPDTDPRPTHDSLLDDFSDLVNP